MVSLRGLALEVQRERRGSGGNEGGQLFECGIDRVKVGGLPICLDRRGVRERDLHACSWLSTRA